MLFAFKNARGICGRNWLMLSVLVLSLLAGCGGGGGGDDNATTDDPAPPIPSRVKYYAGGPGGDPGTTGMTLLIDNTITVDATFRLEGSYTPATKLYSLNLSPVPRIGMNASGIGFILPIQDAEGNFGLWIDETLQWTFGQHPTTGAFRVAVGNYIQVTVNNNADGSGTPGVDLQLVEFGITEASATLTWAQFVAVLNDINAPEYQRQASLAYLVLQRLYQPLQGVVQNFGTIAQQESALEAAGSGTALAVPLCSMLNTNTGTFNLTWIDAPGEIANAMGPGDHFTIGVDSCWLDDPSTSSDLLYASGQLLLNSYGESTTPFHLGFVDVDINDLLLTQTEDVGGGVINLGSSTLFNTFSTVANRNGFLIDLTPDVSGTLNLVNVVQVAEATATAITLPSEVGNFTVGLLDDALTSGIQMNTVLCPVSGSYDYMLSNLAFGVGETMTVTFNNCVQGTVADPSTVNGSYVLTATAFVSTDNLGFTLALNNITTLDDVGLSTINGQTHFARSVSSGTSNEVSSSVTGQSLSISENGVSGTLSNFSISGSRALSGLTLGAPGETFTLQLSSLSDPLSGQITSTFSGPEMLDLQAGSVRVTAPDSSNLLLSITDAMGTVSLDLDSDGDGSAEDTVITDWSDLY